MIVRDSVDGFSCLEVKSEREVGVLRLDHTNQFSNTFEDLHLVYLNQLDLGLVIFCLNFFFVFHGRSVNKLLRQSEQTEDECG